MASQEIWQRFGECLRYKQARAWQKPCLAPARFVRNQFHKHVRPPGRPGTLRVVRTFHCPEFTVVTGENISEEISCYGVFEPALTEAFLRLVEPGQVVVDIGMHIGYFTTLFACLVGTEGEVHAFEPTPSTREMAIHNFRQFRQIRVHPYAVWSDVRTISFQDYGTQWMAFNSFTRAKADRRLPSPTPFEVQTTTLDQFRTELGKPVALVKIDAEAAEEAILSGATKLLKGDRPIVTLEVGDYDGITSQKRIEMLESYGYIAWEFSGGELRPHERQKSYTYDNLIFAPAERRLA